MPPSGLWPTHSILRSPCQACRSTEQRLLECLAQLDALLLENNMRALDVFATLHAKRGMRAKRWPTH